MHVPRCLQIWIYAAFYFYYPHNAILHPTKILLFDVLCIAITYCKYLPYCENVRCSVAVRKTMQGHATKNTGDINL